jgi:hypothetical protein
VIRLQQRPAAGALLAIGFVLLLSCSGTQEQPEVQAAGEVAAIDPGVEAGSVAVAATSPIRTLIVEVYFPSAEENGLVAEAREIFATAAPGDRAKQIVADLISGPATELAVRGLPRNTRLRQIYVLENGVAYLDFTDELRNGLGGGSNEELLAVYSIVDSVVLNVPEILRVGFLINSKPVDTLNGHMSLRRPLRPDISLIVGRIAALPRESEWDAVARAGTGNERSRVR